ncbi:hypothetical protein [Amycolatopsis benzoatilytica]|uniref:hypothetical protein n=1 Tax=Amycolatopsis benzoatilytica TaxID=346045 RepID=UPI0012B681AA|nr:hypothetical protein [Amycolatopsis benzoatilytica]
MTTGRTLFLEVWGYDYPCSQCQRPMTWVFGLRPWYRPAVGELVTCDKPMAVDVARDILEREGRGDLAAQLRPRPLGARGASFNPNTCAACGDQADWHALDDVIIRALHDDFPVLARARVEVARWRELTQERTYVIAF